MCCGGMSCIGCGGARSEDRREVLRHAFAIRPLRRAGAALLRMTAKGGGDAEKRRQATRAGEPGATRAGLLGWMRRKSGGKPPHSKKGGAAICGSCDGALQNLDAWIFGLRSSIFDFYCGRSGYSALGKRRCTRSAKSSNTAKARTLPSGPAAPPVSHFGPTDEELSRRPTPSRPLSGVP